jgi:hypothetical protein
MAYTDDFARQRPKGRDPMSAATTTAKEAWENEFREPSLDELRGMYQDAELRLFDSCREGAEELDDVTWRINWEGVPWRWCLRFEHPEDGEQPFAYLVPAPEGPELCVPLTSECVDSIPLRRLKRYGRDGIVKAKKVGSVRWPSWTISAKTELEEMLEVLKRKHRFLTGK